MDSNELMAMAQANWPVIAVVLAALLLVWFLFGRSSTPRGRSHRPDVLDEGVGPAQRNQALIDAAPAAAVATPLVMPNAETVAAPPLPPAPTAFQSQRLPPRHDPSPEMPDETPTEPHPAPQLPATERPLPATEPEAPPAQPVDPEPAPDMAPPAAPAGADDLSRIKGLGPKLQKLLPQLGITSFAQIAALSDADLAALDAQLGAFAGRPARDGWVEQARYLAAGDAAGFEARFGKV